MKILRQLSVFLAIALAPVAFCASITAQSAITYTEDGVTKTLAAGETASIPDGSTFALVRGAVSVQGTANVNTGNGTAAVTGGSMFVEVSGNRARVSNPPGATGTVTFTKPTGEVTTIATGSEIFSAIDGVNTLVVVVDVIGDLDLPGFEIGPIGTPL